MYFPLQSKFQPPPPLPGFKILTGPLIQCSRTQLPAETANFCDTTYILVCTAWTLKSGEYYSLEFQYSFCQLSFILDVPSQKYSRLRCLLRVKGLVIFYYLGWSGSILQFRQNIIKIRSKSWLLTCSSNITLSLPSYTGSALKRELKKINLYFCTQ